MYTIVAVLATALISSTVAMKACDNTIIEKLKTNGDCYNGGNPPADTMISDVYRVVRMSAGEMASVCTNICGLQTLFQLTFYTSTNLVQNTACLLQEIKRGDYYEESPVSGSCDIYSAEAKFKLYPIHHESNVYSYYRCIDGGTPEDGNHMGVVAIHHQNTDEAAANLVIQKAEKCFSALGITVNTIPACNTL